MAKWRGYRHGWGGGKEKGGGALVKGYGQRKENRHYWVFTHPAPPLNLLVRSVIVPLDAGATN